MPLQQGRYEAADPGRFPFAGKLRHDAADRMVLRITRGADPRTIENVSGDIFYEGGRNIVSFYGQIGAGALQQDGEAIGGTPVFLFNGNVMKFHGSSFRIEPAGERELRAWFGHPGGDREVRMVFVEPALRMLNIQVHGLAGIEPPEREVVVDAMEAAMDSAGIRCRVSYDAVFNAYSASGGKLGVDELHDAMLRLATPPVRTQRLDWWVHCLFADRFSHLRQPLGDDTVMGVMYDVSPGPDSTLPGSPPRQGFAVFLGSNRFRALARPQHGPWERQREWERELRFTLMHEVGHALNLPHCFPERDDVCSWMNTPDKYRADDGRHGADAFWAAFETAPGFDQRELRFLHHAPFWNIAPGYNRYGAIEVDFQLNHAFGDDVAALEGGAKRRRASALRVAVSPLKRIYAFGEPVFLRLTLENTGSRSARYIRAFDPSDSTVTIRVTGPDGKARTIEPIMALCEQRAPELLKGGTRVSFDGICATCDARGPLFPEPGLYRIDASYCGLPGRTLRAAPCHLRVLRPNRAEEYFAYRLWDDPMLMRALYLRQPLLARESWQELVDVYAPPLTDDPRNTTMSYLAYISALGWQRTFRPFGGKPFDADPDKAAERVAGVGFDGLPSSVVSRCARIREDASGQKKKAPPRRKPRKA